MLRKLYPNDDAAKRMRRRVLSVIFAAAFCIIIGMIVFDFWPLRERFGHRSFTNPDFSSANPCCALPRTSAHSLYPLPFTHLGAITACLTWTNVQIAIVLLGL
jgi:hypothetical protein